MIVVVVLSAMLPLPTEKARANRPDCIGSHIVTTLFGTRSCPVKMQSATLITTEEMPARGTLLTPRQGRCKLQAVGCSQIVIL